MQRNNNSYNVSRVISALPNDLSYWRLYHCHARRCYFSDFGKNLENLLTFANELGFCDNQETVKNRVNF